MTLNDYIHVNFYLSLFVNTTRLVTTDTLSKARVENDINIVKVLFCFIAVANVFKIHVEQDTQSAKTLLCPQFQIALKASNNKLTNNSLQEQHRTNVNTRQLIYR